MAIGNDDDSIDNIVTDLIVDEKERCLAFANNNPEIVLPDSLDLDSDELVKTPVRSCFSNQVGTADVLGRTLVVLTKVKPCGLYHLFKILLL